MVYAAQWVHIQVITIDVLSKEKGNVFTDYFSNISVWSIQITTVDRKTDNVLIITTEGLNWWNGTTDRDENRFPNLSNHCTSDIHGEIS